MSDRQYSEKRDFMRMQIDSDAQIIRPNGDNITANCSNLSSTGVLINTPAALPEGEMLVITIPSERPEFPDFCAEAKVLRCTEVSETQFKVALEIERIK